MWDYGGWRNEIKNMTENIDVLAKKIWDYHHLHHTLEKADCIFVLGSHDLRVAEYSAQLFLKGYAPWIIFSGGIAHHGDLLETSWNKTEAEIFAKRAIQQGVPEDKIIIENKAKNEIEKNTKMVRFVHAVPKFVGEELEEYGPFEEEDVASLPAEIARILINKGRAEKIDDK